MVGRAHSSKSGWVGLPRSSHSDRLSRDIVHVMVEVMDEGATEMA
jgi:hypothetical protein